MSAVSRRSASGRRRHAQREARSGAGARTIRPIHIDAVYDKVAKTITFTGVPGDRWIAVTGPYDLATGVFTATGSGVAAGIAAVPAAFSGTIVLATGGIVGQVTLSGSATTPPGGLPGHSVTYDLTGQVAGPTP